MCSSFSFCYHKYCNERLREVPFEWIMKVNIPQVHSFILNVAKQQQMWPYYNHIAFFNCVIFQNTYEEDLRHVTAVPTRDDFLLLNRSCMNVYSSVRVLIIVTFDHFGALLIFTNCRKISPIVEICIRTFTFYVSFSYFVSFFFILQRNL